MKHLENIVGAVGQPSKEELLKDFKALSQKYQRVRAMLEDAPPRVAINDHRYWSWRDKAQKVLTETA